MTPISRGGCRVASVLLRRPGRARAPALEPALLEDRCGRGEPQLLGDEGDAERRRARRSGAARGRSLPISSRTAPSIASTTTSAWPVRSSGQNARLYSAAAPRRRRAGRRARLTTTSATPSAMWNVVIERGSRRGTRSAARALGAELGGVHRADADRVVAAGTSCSSWQPTQASVPSITGMPSWTVCGTSANFASSGACEANSRARSLLAGGEHVDAEALRARAPRAACARRCRSRRAAAAARATSEQTALAVMPTGPRGRVDGHDRHAGGEVPHDGAEAVGVDAPQGRICGEAGVAYGGAGRLFRMLPALMRRRLALVALARARRGGIVACGSEGIELPQDRPELRGRQIFDEHCSGCHTLDVAGTRARRSSEDARVQGRPELRPAQGAVRQTSSTRSATAASPPARCRRTSSSARTPRRWRTSSRSTPAARRKTPAHAASAARCST